MITRKEIFERSALSLRMKVVSAAKCESERRHLPYSTLSRAQCPAETPSSLFKTMLSAWLLLPRLHAASPVAYAVRSALGLAFKHAQLV
jgi:hypothetical protein